MFTGPSQATSVLAEHNRQISNTGQCAREKNMLSQMMTNAYTCECENGFVRIGNHKDIGEVILRNSKNTSYFCCMIVFYDLKILR